jgi:hypothetical protein
MRRFVFTLITAVALLSQAGYAEKKVELQSTSAVPAAKGMAVVQHDRNGNVEVKLSVEHLAKPDQLSPAKQAYVVWIQPEGQSATNAGVLRVNNELKGDFRTNTPAKKFDLLVTAEDSPTATSPSGTEIMRQHMQAE